MGDSVNSLCYISMAAQPWVGVGGVPGSREEWAALGHAKASRAQPSGQGGRPLGSTPD